MRRWNWAHESVLTLVPGSVGPGEDGGEGDDAPSGATAHDDATEASVAGDGTNGARPVGI